MMATSLFVKAKDARGLRVAEVTVQTRGQAVVGHHPALPVPVVAQDVPALAAAICAPMATFLGMPA